MVRGPFTHNCRRTLQHCVGSVHALNILMVNGSFTAVLSQQRDFSTTFVKDVAASPTFKRHDVLTSGRDARATQRRRSATGLRRTENKRHALTPHRAVSYLFHCFLQ